MKGTCFARSESKQQRAATRGIRLKVRRANTHHAIFYFSQFHLLRGSESHFFLPRKNMREVYLTLTREAMRPVYGRVFWKGSESFFWNMWSGWSGWYERLPYYYNIYFIICQVYMAGGRDESNIFFR